MLAVECIFSFVMTVETPTFSLALSGTFLLTTSSFPSITSARDSLISISDESESTDTVSFLYPGRCVSMLSDFFPSETLMMACPFSSVTALISEFDFELIFTPSSGISRSASRTTIFISFENICEINRAETNTMEINFFIFLLTVK